MTRQVNDRIEIITFLTSEASTLTSNLINDSKYAKMLKPFDLYFNKRTSEQ